MTRATTGLLLVLSAACAQAQTSSTQPRTFGVVAGINLAKVAGSDAPGSGRRTAFVGGATMSLPIAPNWAFAPELTYSMKGSKESDQDFTGTIKLSYLELPALLRFDIPTSGGVKPFVFAGPAFALKTGCSVEVSGGGFSASTSCTAFEDSTGDAVKFKSFDTGAMFGGGLAFDVAGRTMRLGVRYNIGLVEITDQSDAKHRVLSFTGSYEWPFHK